MYLVAKSGLISIVRNSLTMREEHMHQLFLPNSGCKSHRALLIWPNGQKKLLLWQLGGGCIFFLCRPVRRSMIQVNTDTWRLHKYFHALHQTSRTAEREGALLSLPLHAVNLGREVACQKTRHFFFKPGQFTLRSVF